MSEPGTSSELSGPAEYSGPSAYIAALDEPGRGDVAALDALIREARPTSIR